MKVLTNLSHYPIIGVDDYDKVDGIHAGETDAMALSVGFAQYNEEHISAKVFRYIDNKWSRQSEELPLHRTFDLATLTLKSILMNACKDTPTTQTIDAVVVSEEYKEQIKEFYVNNRKEILPKIAELQQALNYFMAHEPVIK